MHGVGTRSQSAGGSVRVRGVLWTAVPPSSSSVSSTRTLGAGPAVQAAVAIYPLPEALLEPLPEPPFPASGSLVVSSLRSLTTVIWILP